MKSSSITIISILLSSLVFGLLWWQWKDYGVVAEEEKVVFDTPEVKNMTPRIYAVNRRVLQYEKITLSQFAKATDVDGHDLSGELCCYNERGTQISGLFDTSRPGKFLLSWEVKSKVNGRRAQKQILVLVDGRVCS